MPKIINAYSDASGSIADSLKSLGESMFGDQAKNSVLRETAKEKGRHNDNAEPYARALRDHDASAALYYGSQAGHLGQDLGAGNLAAAAAGAGKNYADPTLATMALGAGHSYSGTVPGERENIAQRDRAASESTSRTAATQIAITERQIQQQQWADEHTLVNLRGPDGRITMVPKSQVSNLQAHGYDVMPSLDNVKAGILQPQPSAQPGGAGLSNDQRAIAGLPHKTQEQVETDQRLNAPIPPAPTGDMTESPATQQAGDTTGLVPAAQHHANSLVGALPLGPALLQATTGSPQVGPGQEAARSAQDLRNNRLMSTLMGFPGRPSVFAQHLVDRLLPKGPAIGNPATEQQHVAAIVSQLQNDRIEAARNVQNQALPPTERAKYSAHLQTIDADLRMLLPPQAGAQAPQQSAQQGGEIVVQNGWRYKRDGTPIGPVQ